MVPVDAYDRLLARRSDVRLVPQLLGKVSSDFLDVSALRVSRKVGDVCIMAAVDAPCTIAELVVIGEEDLEPAKTTILRALAVEGSSGV